MRNGWVLAGAALALVWSVSVRGSAQTEARSGASGREATGASVAAEAGAAAAASTDAHREVPDSAYEAGLTPEYIREMENMAEGTSCGYGLGFSGIGSSQGIHCTFTLWHSDTGVGLSTRVISRWNHGPWTMGFYDPIWYNGAQIFMRSPLVLGIFRLYGGGGGWLGWRPAPTEDPATCGRADGQCELERTVTFSGGGLTGLEFFLDGRSYFLEVGAQGSAHPNRWDGGLYVWGGSNFYF